MLNKALTSSDWSIGSENGAVQLRHTLGFPGSDAASLLANGLAAVQLEKLAPQKISIETPRLILNDFQEDEFPEFYSLFEALDEAGQSWLLATVRKPETIRIFFDEILDNQRAVPRQTYRLAVRLKSNDEIIGYVSLCDLYSTSIGKPDTGVLIDPKFQRGGFARESRVAINYFAVQAGAEDLYCDVRTDNTPSINNVLKMGYEQLLLNGVPVMVENQGVMGSEKCYRYRIERAEILNVLPRLVQQLAQRYWRYAASEITWTTPDIINEMIRVSYNRELSWCQSGSNLRWPPVTAAMGESFRAAA
jgi:RimJ/RimL family protein N-acetyltransferase